MLTKIINWVLIVNLYQIGGKLVLSYGSNDVIIDLKLDTYTYELWK